MSVAASLATKRRARCTSFQLHIIIRRARTAVRIAFCRPPQHLGAASRLSGWGRRALVVVLPGTRSLPSRKAPASAPIRTSGISGLIAARALHRSVGTVSFPSMTPGSSRYGARTRKWNRLRGALGDSCTMKISCHARRNPRGCLSLQTRNTCRTRLESTKGDRPDRHGVPSALLTQKLPPRTFNESQTGLRPWWYIRSIPGAPGPVQKSAGVPGSVGSQAGAEGSAAPASGSALTTVITPNRSICSSRLDRTVLAPRRESMVLVEGSVTLMRPHGSRSSSNAASGSIVPIRPACSQRSGRSGARPRIVSGRSPGEKGPVSPDSGLGWWSNERSESRPAVVALKGHPS